MSDTADTLQPTIIYEPSAERSKTSSSEVSQLPVGLVAGTAPRFSDETAVLLRSRLKAVTLALTIGSVFSVMRDLANSASLLAVFQGALFVAMLVAYLTLRSRFTLSLGQLRLIELFGFGSVLAGLCWLGWMVFPQLSGNEVALFFVAFSAGFCMLILIYAMFIPNTWQRAVIILVPVAFLPTAVVLASGLGGETAARLFLIEPLTVVIACVAAYGTHVVNSTRKVAFKARQFGQYRLKDKLGSGGMGEVYRAEHMLLKRPCVIKLIKQDQSTDAAALARFEREVCSTARLTHWNSVEIFDYGHTEDGVFYYVMEYLRGKSLDDLIQEHGPMPAERAVHFLRQTCDALREAHHLGLIHRDLKPANIFAAQLGGVCDVTKLLDFGLVRQANTDQPHGVNSNRNGGFSGSPQYMPPEQVTSYDEVDGRGDIYSLGAVAYFLVTGAPPFSGRNTAEVVMAHANEHVTSPATIVSTIPSSLERIILRCLEKKPRDRFQDVESLEEALAACECADEWTEKKAAKWWDDVGECGR